MKLIDCTLEEFSQICNSKKIICFGASEMPLEMCTEYPEYRFADRIEYFVDNDSEKQGKNFNLQGRIMPIISPEKMGAYAEGDHLLLITSKYYADIYWQLNEMPDLSELQCCIWPMIAPQYKSDLGLKEKIKAFSSEIPRIPKIIHYCWFGGNELPGLERKCLESWRKVCPDYKIMRWDEKNYDITKNPYMKQAYERNMWGFVPDYARLDIILEHGGIYLDTDVELIRSLDGLLGLPGFAGFESKKYVNLGLGFGAASGNHVIGEMLEYYDYISFLNSDGQMNLAPSPVYQTKVLRKMGLYINNKIQAIEDMVILPAECFSPDNNLIPHVTENTISIHHFSGSWTSETNRDFLMHQRDFCTGRI